ncbi:ATP-binding cassette domain-containing protein [Aestuariispira ectoiniformans]|uniref:ATP-binding cassette domain-containing protein n=1 Tax=Aestuariispira ectoiniformans TaxID=2775080 RepID=UPI00223C2640|nr:ATP-binding cassette domain-containing protein [Aestuariispira ectoiniformans]
MTDKTTPKPSLILRNISIELRGHPLFEPIDLTVNPGQAVTIMGPSGSGKSTLLAYLCGSLGTDFTASGQVALGAKDLTTLPPERRHLGILFQDDLLFPHLSVADNLAFGLPPGLNKADREARIATAMTEAGLQGFGDRDPATLSGGQRARISCLRTLLSEPGALLLDEPFSKLDAALRDRFRRFVFDQARDLPVILVTHDPGDAEAAGGPVLTLQAH